MIVTIALITVLNGQLFDLETYEADYNPQSVHAALMECKKKERMLKPCMMRLQRSEKVTTYVNLDSWYQFNVYNN